MLDDFGDSRILEHCSRIPEHCSRILEATLSQKLRNIGPNLGHSRNGVARLSQIGEILIQFGGILEMGRLGCPNKRNIGPNLGHPRNAEARLSQIGKILVQIWDILEMARLGCPK